MKPMLLTLALFAAALPAQAADAGAKPAPKTDDARAYVEKLRTDTNATKIKLLNDVMQLTADEARKFWPVYREYEAEQSGVAERKVRLIQEFFTLHRDGKMTNESAKKLAPQWLQVAQDRLDLWKKYHAKISTAVSPLRAAQFLQVENQLAIFVDFGIASEMPSLGATPITK